VHGPIWGSGGLISRLSRTVPMCEDHARILAKVLPRLGSGNADIVRASQFQHAVEDMHSHVDFGLPTFVYTRA